MKAFAALYRALDASTSQRAKQDALAAYLRTAPPADAAWAVYFLAGGKPRQLVPTSVLRSTAQDAAALPVWLFDECYEAVGDLAETLALLLPPPAAPLERPLSDWLEHHLLPLRGQPRETLPATLRAQWDVLPAEQRLVTFKLITGAFRVGVSRLQVTQVLAQLSGVDAKLIAQRLMGTTHTDHRPGAADWATLLAPETPVLFTDGAATQDTRPYPFFLSHPLLTPLDTIAATLGPVDHWQVEWKWDGIRAQLVRRSGAVALWSRGEDLITDRFPELVALGMALPDGTVLDGEILIGDATRVRPFADLQKRTTRKALTPKLLRELPALLMAFDVLEADGQDLRAQPQARRRAALEALAATHPHAALRLSPLLHGANWPALAALRQAARAQPAEGLMLKHREARYGVGRTRGDGTWWKWKLDPMSVDAVLVYAQRGHGRRASLYSDYTFAVWSGPPDQPERTLVPFAKAYSGLTDEEMRKVDTIVRRTTRESFGPVRSVEPTLVFELGFEGIQASPRHKSGIAVRFPRMLRWRDDKPVAEADTLAALHQLLNQWNGP
jgi:DNA ligase-1